MRCCLVALAIACACGDDLTGTPLAELDAELDRARCERFARCGLFVDEPTCSASLRDRPERNVAAAVDAGLVLYDGPSARLCLDALAALPCDETGRAARVRPLACEQMFAGTLAAGESCALAEECISGACDVPACLDACCTGTCRAGRGFADVDEACALDDDCVDDAFCGEDLLCHPLGGEGDTCRSDRECEFHRGCIGPTELQAGNCRAMPLVGEPCLYQRCAELGVRCEAGSCVAVGLPGAPCTRGTDCSPFNLCDPDTDTCIELPVLGERCTVDCAGESFCDFLVTATCVAPQPNGTFCDARDECLSLHCEEGAIFSQCADQPLCF